MVNNLDAKPKLSKVQAKVMLWLSQGWGARVAYGSAVEINGQRQCNTATLFALERQGLVHKEPDGLWSATAEGKKLSPRYCEAEVEQQ